METTLGIFYRFSLCQSHTCIFLRFSSCVLGGVLRSKAQGSGAAFHLQWCGLEMFIILMLIIRSIQLDSMDSSKCLSVEFKYFCQFMTPATSALGNRFQLWLPICFSRIWGEVALLSHFPNKFSKSHWFSLCPDFSCCKKKSDDFQAFYMLEVKLEVFHTTFSLPFIWVHYRQRLYLQDLEC